MKSNSLSSFKQILTSNTGIQLVVCSSICPKSFGYLSLEKICSNSTCIMSFCNCTIPSKKEKFVESTGNIRFMCFNECLVRSTMSSVQNVYDTGMTARFTSKGFLMIGGFRVIYSSQGSFEGLLSCLRKSRRSLSVQFVNKLTGLS